jgi:S-adenosylmethionine uptake transporter
VAARSLSPAAAFAVGTLGIAVFSAMDAVMKGLVLALGVYTVMLWRSLAGVLLSGAVYAGKGAPWPARAAMRLHWIRGAVSSVMALLFFWGLARVPMAQAIALAFIAPVIALVLSALLLKERVAATAFGASAIAFTGVLVILAGQASTDAGPDAFRGALAVLASAICYAFNIVLMRAQAQLAGPVEVAFWQSVVVSLCLLPAAPWLATRLPAEHAPMIFLAAFLAVGSLMLLGWAYAHGPASYLAPTEYTSFVWASLFGWLVFREPVSAWTLAGAMLIVGGCVFAARGRPAPLEGLP